MKIFELLSGDTDTSMQQPDMTSMTPTQPFGNPGGGTSSGTTPDAFANMNSAATQPFGNPGGGTSSGTAPDAFANANSATTPTTPMQRPQQQAGLWDMAKDFMSTPQPIGGTKPTPPTPTPPTPGQPPAQSSGMINRPFGGSAVGRNIDAINKGLTPPTPTK